MRRLFCLFRREGEVVFQVTEEVFRLCRMEKKRLLPASEHLLNVFEARAVDRLDRL
jgi:hypothetical protein